MKRGTPDHPKTKRLMRELNCEKLLAVGLLESLWLFTAEFCPDGELSKYAEKDLADQLGYGGDAVRLLCALHEAGWLDRTGKTLRVHDWPEHAQDSVHMKLARAKRCFADGTIPNFKRLPPKDRQEAEAHFVQIESARRAHEEKRAHGGSVPSHNPPLPSPPLPGLDLDQGERESASYQQPTPPAFPNPGPDEPRSPEPALDAGGVSSKSDIPLGFVKRGPPHLEPIREALAEATGQAPDAAIVADLAYAGAKLGAHPAALAKWIFRKARGRAEIRAMDRPFGLFAKAIPEDLPAWLQLNGDPINQCTHTACRCGQGEAIQFADCIVGHACPTMPRGGLRKAAVPVGVPG